MSTLTKPKTSARKVAPKPRRAAATKLVFRKDLPAITPESPLYGHDSFVGCVSLDLPQSKGARRERMRARIHADNHS